MGFVNSTIIDYPVEEVFKVFIRTAKRDFPKFNEKEPIGCYVTKTVGTYSAKTGTCRVEITDYKLNELYQITSVKDKMVYVSTYTFEKETDESTKITLEETEDTPGAFQWANIIIQKVCFKGTVKRRFGVFANALEKAIEDYREKVAKAMPKNELEVSVDLNKEDSNQKDEE
ncbi:MAG: DUF3284 domain-containing protein [Clostridium sp.]|uniref:DUF3284 domain-containing protein n=1 Tax=Clostridium sp. TaxID=1506 RepID=UPI003EE5EC92